MYIYTHVLKIKVLCALVRPVEVINSNLPFHIGGGQLSVCRTDLRNSLSYCWSFVIKGLLECLAVPPVRVFWSVLGFRSSPQRCCFPRGQVCAISQCENTSYFFFFFCGYSVKFPNAKTSIRDKSENFYNAFVNCINLKSGQYNFERFSRVANNKS